MQNVVSVQFYPQVPTPQMRGVDRVPGLLLLDAKGLGLCTPTSLITTRGQPLVGRNDGGGRLPGVVHP